MQKCVNNYCGPKKVAKGWLAGWLSLSDCIKRYSVFIKRLRIMMERIKGTLINE